jgi:hypothetical protein
MVVNEIADLKMNLNHPQNVIINLQAPQQEGDFSLLEIEIQY